MSTRFPVSACLVVMLASMMLIGCAQTRTGSQMKPINNANRLTGGEWDQFANWMKNSMIQSGVLNRHQGPGGTPVVIAIADWDNNTNQPVFTRDKTVMENAIRKTLVNSGQAVVNRDIGGTGAKPDSLTQNITSLRNSAEYDQSTVPPPGQAKAPSLGLYMQINRIPVNQGRTTQYDYAVKCELIDLQAKYTVWEDQFLMSKQFVRGL
ncbi:MAG: penicillin-binding protein activator LpoB [Phycisphaerales bacterium]|nr:penicillin-binding protein activator LpoB [Phycisphaerales bacterium]